MKYSFFRVGPQGDRWAASFRGLWAVAVRSLVAASQVVLGSGGSSHGGEGFFGVTNLTLRPRQVTVEGKGLFSGVDVRPVGLSRVNSMIYDAMRLSREEKAQEAIALLSEVLEIEPTNRVARTTMSVIYTSQGKGLESIRLLEGLIHDYPGDVGIQNNLAWVYATSADKTLRDGVRSVELSKRALIQSPRNFHVWSTLSEGYYITGNFRKAATSAYEALRLVQEGDASREDILIYREQLRRAKKAFQAFQLVR